MATALIYSEKTKELLVELTVKGESVEAKGPHAESFRERAVRGLLMFDGDEQLAMEFALRGTQYLKVELR